MRLGLPEIIITIAVIIAVVMIARIIRPGRNAPHENTESSADTPTEPADEGTNKIRNFLKKAGIALVLTGVILLIAGMSMFRWALQSYAWSFIIVIIGFLLVFLPRKKH